MPAALRWLHAGILTRASRLASHSHTLAISQSFRHDPLVGESGCQLTSSKHLAAMAPKSLAAPASARAAAAKDASSAGKRGAEALAHTVPAKAAKSSQPSRPAAAKPPRRRDDPDSNVAKVARWDV